MLLKYVILNQKREIWPFPIVMLYSSDTFLGLR